MAYSGYVVSYTLKAITSLSAFLRESRLYSHRNIPWHWGRTIRATHQPRGYLLSTDLRYLPEPFPWHMCSFIICKNLSLDICFSFIIFPGRVYSIRYLSLSSPSTSYKLGNCFVVDALRLCIKCPAVLLITATYRSLLPHGIYSSHWSVD